MSACAVEVDGVVRHKRTYTTKGAANRAARQFNAHIGGRRKRGYRCPACGLYHIGGRS